MNVTIEKGLFHGAIIWMNDHLSVWIILLASVLCILSTVYCLTCAIVQAKTRYEFFHVFAGNLSITGMIPQVFTIIASLASYLIDTENNVQKEAVNISLSE